MSELAPAPFSERILIVRGQRVMLDADLAELYGVPTKRFNEQVKRNLARFPLEFMFQLTQDEFHSLRSQFATSNSGSSQNATSSPGRGGGHPAQLAQGGGRRSGLARDATRPFAGKPAPTRKVSSHDQALAGVIDAIRQLMAPPQTKKRPIGFVTDPEENA